MEILELRRKENCGHGLTHQVNILRKRNDSLVNKHLSGGNDQLVNTRTNGRYRVPTFRPPGLR